MIAALRAELVKVLRRRVLIVTALATVAVAVGSAAVVLASAEPVGRGPSGRGVTLASLSEDTTASRRTPADDGSPSRPAYN